MTTRRFRSAHVHLMLSILVTTITTDQRSDHEMVVWRGVPVKDFRSDGKVTVTFLIKNSPVLLLK